MRKETIPFPKGEIKAVFGHCLVLRGDDIDTDRIIPARFLKCVSFDKLGSNVFADDRKEMRGKHPFDHDLNRQASILVVNENFGCGSSREHAPQALMRWGIRALIGESFAEIFYGNCLALGIPCATASKEKISKLQTHITENPRNTFELNLMSQELFNKNHKCSIEIQAGTLEMLTTGRWDATSQLIARNDCLKEIASKLPYLNNFKGHQ